MTFHFFREALVLCLLAGFVAWGCKPQQQGQTGKNNTRPGRTQPASLASNPSLTAKFVDAATAQAQGDADRAIQLYKEVLAMDARNVATNYNLGLLFAGKRQFEAALPHAEAAVRAQEPEIWFYVLLGEVQGNLGQWEKATQTFKAAAARFDNEPDLLQRQANALVQQRKFADVFPLLETYENRTGDAEMVAHQRKQLYLMMNQPEQAVQVLRDLIRKHPDARQAYVELFGMLTQLNRATEGVAVLESYLQRDPNDGEVLLMLVDYYVNSGQMAKAEPFVRAALANPNLPTDQKLRLFGYLTQQNPQQAEDMALELFRNQPNDPNVGLLLARRRLAQNQPDSARKVVRRVLAADPVNEQAWLLLGTADLQLKQPDSLVRHMYDALVVNPNNPDFLFFKGLGYLHLKKHAEAVRPLERAIMVLDAQPETKAKVLVALADAYSHTERDADAERVYREALGLAPTNTLALNNLANFLAVRSQKLPEALRLIEKAIGREPENPAYQDTYAWVLFRLERYPEAKRWAERAYSAEPSGDVAERLGDIHFRLENPDKAVFYWQEAVRLGLDIPRIRQKIINKSL